MVLRKTPSKSPRCTPPFLSWKVNCDQLEGLRDLRYGSLMSQLCV